MKVKAVDGVKVPMENQPYNYIVGDAVVEVEDSVYYHRRLSDGDLVLVEEQAVSSGRKNAKSGEK
ncbi:DUF2635 domain-containing protein [Otariodibacter oris]|uniref:Uncharacterized protein DUF2635 n=1 Tax=Otariodibacter oris TaxID=1032623 RepID=A0A420XIJ2_9PAST|nr:DUF2635 domain-containing protein [Otariodibacter oris]QGM80663.1 DUF2635 domain-containing protein [Otariodibacter oris]RKR77177.1 uncharacterized protein DUF2635 [Otariodibacter oris]